MTCKDKKTRVSLLVVTKAALPFSPTYLSSKNAMNSPACNILQLSDSLNYFKASLVLSRAERRGEASEAKDKPNCAYRARIPFPSVRSHDTRGSKRRSQREKESDEKQNIVVRRVNIRNHRHRRRLFPARGLIPADAKTSRRATRFKFRNGEEHGRAHTHSI